MLPRSMLLCLLSSLAFAQGGPGPSSGGMERGNLLRIPAYKTTSAQSWYVNASTGSDSNNCTDSTTPCLTIQGAVNKVPKLLQYGVTVNVAAGTYGCFYVSGFACDPSVQQTTGGLMIDGYAAFTNSTLATGTATGTATAGSAGTASPPVYGTLTDGAQTWTVNDLRGRFLILTGGTGSGQTRTISSNTGTVVTITGVFSPAPDATTTYAIQDPGVIINTACSSMPLPLTAAGSNAAAMLFYGNNCPARAQAFVVRGVRTANASGLSYVQSDTSASFITLAQLRNSAAASSAAQYGTSSSNAITGFGGRADMQDVSITAGASASGITIRKGLFVPNRVLITGGSVGITVNGIDATMSATAVDLQGATTPISVPTGFISTMSQSQITCAAGTGTGVQVGAVSTNTVSGTAAFANAFISGAVVATCGIGLLANGAGTSAELTGLTGAAGTTGLQAQSGGTIIYTAGTTITGVTQDINIDLGAATAALADITAGTCLATASFGSKVCRR